MKKIFTLLLVSLTTIAVAQEDAPALSISGTVDATSKPTFQLLMMQDNRLGPLLLTKLASPWGWPIWLLLMIWALQV